MEESDKKEEQKPDQKVLDKLKGEAVLSLFFIVLSIWIMARSVVMSQIIHERTGAEIYTLPGIFPFIIALLIFFCSIAVVLNAWRKGIKLSSFSLKGTIDKLKSEEMRILAVVVASMLVYVVLLIPFIPFEIATFLFIFFLYMFFKAAPLRKSLLISLLFSAIVVYFFAEVVKTPFPHSFF